MSRRLLPGLAALTLLVWLPTAIRVALGVRSIRRLRELPPLLPGEPAPPVSVVMAARDEAQAIAASVGSVLSQDYPQLAVVVVNDRSSDATGEILERIAGRDRRLQVLHNRAVPTGWLGKNHALHVGAERASAELILFADADVLLEPTALSRAVAHLERERLDHLTVAPELRVPGFWARAFVAFFSLAFSLYATPWRARDHRSRSHVGIGAFNLVRAAAYRAVGGHSRLPMRPDDDMKLAKVLKEAEFRQDVAFGEGLVAVEWYPGLRAMIRGLEKNSFSALDYSLPATLAASAFGLLVNVWPWAALLATGGKVRLLNAAVVASIFVAWMGSRRAPGVRLRYFVVHPVTATLFTYTVLRSALVTLRQGGIRWRETYYPLSDLRANRL